jgi:hypothetical protein
VSASQNRGTASDKCAITSSESSISTTEYVLVGFTLPSGTIAARLVRVVCRRYANCGDDCTVTGNTDSRPAACSALSTATGTDVTLEDLVTSDGFVVLTDRLDPKGAVLAAIVRGERSWRRLRAKDVGYFAEMAADPGFSQKLQSGIERMRAESARYPWLDDAPTADVVAILERSGLYEDRLAKRLGISHELLAAFSWQLWRRSFSDERDERAGPDANAQTRGRISRILQTELRTQLEKAATDGDD